MGQWAAATDDHFVEITEMMFSILALPESTHFISQARVISEL